MSAAKRSILILTNGMAGRGRSVRTARAAESVLAGAGHRVTLADARVCNGSLEEALLGVDVLVVAGGDGTVMHALPAASAAGTPIYHLGMGNENLLARQFAHGRSPTALAAAVERFAIQTIDLGRCGTSGDGVRRWFATMLSVGPDAAIVHQLAARRTGTVWHGSYALPTAAETLRPTLPVLNVVVDGRVVVEGVRGMVIVANTRQYAVRLDPADRADPGDGLLDVVVLPARSALGLAARLARSRFRRHGAGVVHARGRRVEVLTVGDAPAAVQLDGEAPGVRRGDASGGLCTPVIAEVLPGALRVLRA